jgi:hypothetical protein
MSLATTTIPTVPSTLPPSDGNYGDIVVSGSGTVMTIAGGIHQYPKVRLLSSGDWILFGVWNLAFLLYCLTLIKVKIPAKPKRVVGIHAERKGERIPDFPKERKI